MSSGHWSKGDLSAKRYIYFWVDVTRASNGAVGEYGPTRSTHVRFQDRVTIARTTYANFEAH